ncbi:hypothetical protein C0989_006519, partial [Termitomyces sp. Mn162]
SYLVKANQGYNCTVVEAARATTASPQFFKSVSIGARGLTEKFIGAHLGYNNPMNLVLEEAELVFGASQPVACIVSIGAGHPGHISWKSSKLFTSMLMKVLMDISTSCEASVESFVKQYKNLPGIFYRLNVDQGLQKMALDDWNSLGEIKTHSVNYLHKAEITQKVGSIVDTLHNSPQKITLGRLIGKMLDEDSLSILFKASLRFNSSEAEHAAAKELVQELGNLALAIVQAGGYLHYHQHVKFHQYLENYKKDKPKYLAQVKTHNMDGYSLSAFATWDCSYQKLDRKAKEILMLCSVLHYSKIPVEILEKAWNNLTQNSGLDAPELKKTLELFVEDGNWNNNSLEAALDSLQSYSLVEIRGEGVKLLNIHSLVHVWSYKSLEPKKQKRAQLCAQQLFFHVDEGMKTYFDAVEWVPHLQQLLKLSTVDAIGMKEAYDMGHIF